MVNSIESLQFEDNKRIFKKAYDSVNTKSSEAWFGLNNSLRVGLIAYYTKIQALYRDAYENKKEINKVNFVKSIVTELNGLEKLFENELNVQTCKIGVIDSIDAFTISMDIDKNLTTKSEAAKKLRIDMDDIVETDNGFKFKNKTGKYLIFGIGLRFFEPKLNYSPEEVAAITIHEIGHCFQHMLIGVNTNIVYDIIADNMIQAYQEFKITNIIKSIFTLNPVYIIASLFNPLMGLFHLGKAASLNSQLEKDKGDATGSKLYDKMEESSMVDRTDMGEKNKSNNENIIHNTLKPQGSGIILKTFMGFIKIFKTLLSPIAYLIDAPAGIYLAANTKFFRKNRKFEEFADMFTVYYGLGDELASALSKIGNEYHKNDMGLLNFLNYVPLMNVALNFNYYTHLNTVLLVKGYPEMKMRIANAYKGLEWELEHNKDLSNQDKLTIQNQMVKTETVFNDYVFGKGAKNFIYKIYNTMIKTSIQNDANESTVYDNVISVMEENKSKMINEEQTA